MSLEEKNTSGKSSLLDQWRKRKKKPGDGGAIPPRPKEQPAIPSSGQQRLWLLQQLYPNNPFYQYGHIYKIKGELDVNHLQQSFQELINRHEILRSHFMETDQGLEVVIKNSIAFAFSEFDLTSLSEMEQEGKAYALAKTAASQIFDLSNDLLIRACLIRLSEHQHWLVLSMHHIIGDRWSLQVLQEELFSGYQYLQKGEVIATAPTTIQYADYAFWQKEQKADPRHLSYWLDHLSGDLPLSALPGDFKRPKKPTFRGATYSKQFSPELSDQIRQLAKTNNATPYALMLSAFQVLLYRHSHQTDILIGSPFSNRDKPVLEKLIGFFNETLVLRAQVSDDLPFSDLLASNKVLTLKALKHKNVPFDELVRALKPERQGSANPLFQVMFVYNKASTPVPSNLDLDIQEEVLDLGISKFDLTLFVNDQQEYLESSLEYSLDLFESKSMERILEQLEVILQTVVTNPHLSISQIPLLNEAEKQQILVEWNDTQVDLPDYSAIHELIQKIAVQYPDKTAVVYQDDEISYAELDQQANALAASLLAAGLKANSPVGLYTERSVHMLVGILGILKAGAGYLPLDPDYPADRIEYMLKDSGTSFILSQEALITKLDFSAATIIAIETAIKSDAPKEWKTPEVKPDQLAYLIYTSGSTGMPKGVPIQHKNLLHSTIARFHFYPTNPSSFLLLSSFSFDSSVVGIFWTLCSGGTLVLPQKRIEQDVALLGNLIFKHQVSHTLMLSSLYSTILSHASSKKLRSLRCVMVAGEACPFPLIDKHVELMPTTELYNEYGPTEATVWCIAHKIQAGEKHFVPIGKAIPNTEVYILDKHFQPVPIGVAGELYIGGLGLSEGYLNRPDLTSERFIAVPFSSGPEKRIYKTGDLARYHADGLIEFLGRADHQVKIRGFRVEPEEIQKVMLEHPLVEEALVIVHTTSNEAQALQQRLIAYVSQLTETEQGILLDYLKGKLPDYMVPSLIIPLVQFPRLPNGKINRKGLPLPSFNALAKSTSFVAPQGEVETKLAAIWQEVLGLDAISSTDNFFAIGGDSILSIQIVSRARAAGILMVPDQLFDHQSIAALARSIEEDKELKVKPAPLPINITSYPLSHLQSAFLFNSKREGRDQGILHLEFTIVGDIHIPSFQQAWQQSAQRHGAMRAFIQSADSSSPLQVIADEASLEWGIYDWRNKSVQEQEEALMAFREEEERKLLNLEEAPVSRMYLFQLAKQKQLLFWTCHHIFLDGWSCGIILKDALLYYEAIQNEQVLELPALPNYPAYLAWSKDQDSSSARHFWQQELAEFHQPLLFKKQYALKGENHYADEQLLLTEVESKRIQDFCRQEQIAQSSFFQGLWALLLGRYFNSDDVVFGLTVSGRFADFPHIESTSGLFMNVLPNRIKIVEEMGLCDWLRAIQKEQGQKSKYGASPLEQIQFWIDWPSHLGLFDSLFLFGNFLKDGLQIGPLEIAEFQGGFSSAYPLTVRVNPLSEIVINWRYDRRCINQTQIDWIKQSFYELAIRLIGDWHGASLRAIMDGLSIDIQRPRLSDVREHFIAEDIATSLSKNYVAPRHPIEIQLVRLWEDLFNRFNIGIEDDFFDLGGQSLMAIQLFATIEKEMGQVLPPSVLLKHSTIAALARVINREPEETKGHSILMPLRKQGNQAPLFCLHGGGAYTFFYRAFALHLPDDQPVYSLQAPGLDGSGLRYAHIEEMAADYLKEIRKVQPEGPYYLLGTCFSNAVALEMGHQLRSVGEDIALLFIIDSGPVHLFGDSPNGERKTLARFYDMLKRGDFSRIRKKIAGRFKKSKSLKPLLPETVSASEKNLRQTIDWLNELYAKYHWKPFDGKIHFIRSEEFHHRADKKYQLKQWRTLAKEGLEVHRVPGHHISLFEEPEVRGLADKVKECMEMAGLEISSM